MDTIAGRRRSSRTIFAAAQSEGKENVDADNVVFVTHGSSKTLDTIQENNAGHIATIRMPMSPGARGSYRASHQHRGSGRVKGFGDGTPPTTPQSLKSLWTAQPTGNADAKFAAIDLTQSPLFTKCSSTNLTQENAVTASPKPGLDTPFKFKVTIAPTRRELVADLDPSAVTPHKNYVPIAVPKLELPLPPTPGQAETSAKKESSYQGSVRKRSGPADYSESPAKRRRISIGTKSTRRTIVPGFPNGTVAGAPGGAREIPTAASIFAPLPPPLSLGDDPSGSDSTTPRSRSGSVSDTAFTLDDTPSRNNSGGNGYLLATPLPSSSVISINTNFTVPSNKDADVPMTIQEIAAWVIFGQDDNDVSTQFILSFLHFQHTPKELFKYLWAFYHQPPLQYWKLISTFANQRARVVNFVAQWVTLSPHDFEWSAPSPQTPGSASASTTKAKESKIPLKFFLKFLEIVRSDGGDSLALVAAQEAAMPYASRGLAETPRKGSVSSSGGASGATSPRRASLLSSASASRRQTKYSARRQSSVKAGESVTFAQIEPGELALQMTLVDWNRLRSVPLSELVGQAWNKTDKARLAPRLTNIINHFNNVSYWVSQEITQTIGTKEQAKAIDRFITVGTKLKDLGNFNGLMQIFSGLMASNVQKLQDAWKLVSSRQQGRYKKFETIMSPFQNSSSYRARLAESTKSPVIPYIGIHLGDIVHLLEGIDDLEPNKFSLQKVLKLGSMLKTWHSWQKQSCDIVEDSDITQFLALLKGAIAKD